MGNPHEGILLGMWREDLTKCGTCGVYVRTDEFWKSGTPKQANWEFHHDRYPFGDELWKFGTPKPSNPKNAFMPSCLHKPSSNSIHLEFLQIGQRLQAARTGPNSLGVLVGK